MIYFADCRAYGRRGCQSKDRKPGRIVAAILSCVFLVCVPSSSRFLAGGQVSPGRVLVDNFEGTAPNNGLGKRSGAFSDPKGLGYCYLFYTIKSEQVLGGKGNSLYVKWDTASPGSWAGYWTDLGHLDLQGFSRLTFHVRGLQGGESFRIGLRGEVNAQVETKLDIKEVLSGGVTAEWQEVIIPLNRFTAIKRWNDVNVFSVSFEYASGSGKGAILVDDIAFEK